MADPGGGAATTELLHELARERVQAKQAALMADVGVALTTTEDKREMLRRCAQAVVDRLDAAFARIWTLDAAASTLVLQASAGMYTHLDGAHSRVPVGQFKIGRIADRRRPHLTNDVLHDAEIADPEWARREGMVAFAGYPLLIGHELIGILAMFARHTLEDSDFEALASAASGISVGISRLRALRALQASEARYRERAEQLARIAAALERSNRELDAFAYAASHDLRAPLRGIANLAQWIEEDLQDKLSEDSREMLALMRSRMHRMESLIDGILQYSRAGRSHEPPRDVDVRALIEDVIDLLAPESAEIAVEEPLPVFRAERLPLQQIFQNLIGNAIKHGGDGVRIEISARDAGEFWEFRVADDGPGIPPQFHDRVWGIFQTLQPRDQVEGAGIGLSLVKKLAEAQGGRVGVESREGEGAAFSVWWPKTVEEIAE